METEFNLISEQIDDKLIITTEGYINNSAGELLLNEMEKHSDKNLKKVLVDLAKTKVVNSIGISFLIEMIEKLNDTDGKLYFTNLDPAIDKTFNIMGLFQYAEKIDSVDQL
ncbi:MAG: STAS domain-containing protein [Ignavibacteriae bacterium]|nr:STAS domain-containing protein [Ignavibacteriota bacterium]